MKFSLRTDGSTEQNRLTIAWETKRRSKGKVFDLTQSNPTACGFQYNSSEKLLYLTARPSLVYRPDPKGAPEARQAIAAYYAQNGYSVSADHIVLTASTSEAYSFVFKLLHEPGDVLWVPKPSYPLLEQLAKLNDLHVEHYTLHKNSGGFWEADWDYLKDALIRTRAKSAVIVHPNNPTGNYVGQSGFDALRPRNHKPDFAVIADEVFFDYAADSGEAAIPRKSFVSRAQGLTFTLSGLSKILGLPQLKLAWIVVSGPDKLRRQALERLEMIGDAYLSVNSPVSYGLELLLSRREEIQEEIKSRLKLHRQRLRSVDWKRYGLALEETEGGWYALLKIVKASQDDEALVLELIEKKGVLVHPGYLYDFEPEEYLVLSLIADEKVFEEGVTRLEEFLREKI